MTTPTDKLVVRLNAEAHDLANRVEAMQAMEEAAAALVAAEDEIGRLRGMLDVYTRAGFTVGNNLSAQPPQETE